MPKVEEKMGNVLSFYALTKLTNEKYAKLYKDLYNLDIYGLRYFNVFGKRQNPDGEYAAIIPKFIKQMLQNEIPTINGTGMQSRDFTYVENVIEANLKACLAKTEKAGEVYNVGAGGNITILEIYNIIAKALNFSWPPHFKEPRLGDIKHSNADITKAQKDLNYCPEYNFEKGIQLTIDWYKHNPKY